MKEKEILTDDRGFKAAEGMSEKRESLFQLYVRRFKKHTLGKIGAFILVIFYFYAIFADFLSPYTMTWTDKRKAFHPPSPIQYIYKDEKNRNHFRPFSYEMVIQDVVFKKYTVVPEYTLRVVTIETIPGFDEKRIVATQEDFFERKKKILTELAKIYGFQNNSEIAEKLSREIDSIHADPGTDITKKLKIGTTIRQGREISQEILLIKGNKNFLHFFFRGVPYKMFDLFPCSIHFFGSPTSGFYFLGADELGRDVYSRLIHGSRVSLSVGIVGIAISFFIGIIVGGISGYFGGILDLVLMRICEIILSFPYLILLFALRATFPPNLTSIQVYLLIIVIMSLIFWASLARIIRGMVLSIKNEEYVLSARAMGLSHIKIILKHIIRNTVSFIIIQATISIPGYILGESALSFLGLGITDPQTSWGLMLSVGRNTRYIKDFPWLLIPGFLIFLAIMAWNFLGDGIRDAVDPHSTY